MCGVLAFVAYLSLRHLVFSFIIYTEVLENTPTPPLSPNIVNLFFVFEPIRKS